MGKVFSVQDRQAVFDYILSVAAECSRIVSPVQVGSGAIGYHDERSDLDFVIALRFRSAGTPDRRGYREISYNFVV